MADHDDLLAKAPVLANFLTSIKQYRDAEVVLDLAAAVRSSHAIGRTCTTCDTGTYLVECCVCHDEPKVDLMAAGEVGALLAEDPPPLSAAPDAPSEELQHLINEWGHLGVVMALLSSLTDDQARRLLDAARKRIDITPESLGEVSPDPNPAHRPHGADLCGACGHIRVRHKTGPCSMCSQDCGGFEEKGADYHYGGRRG